MADSMASRFIDGELLAEDLEFLSDREQELLSGGQGLVVNGFPGSQGLWKASEAGAPLIPFFSPPPDVPPGLGGGFHGVG